jgi:hypothetical protein
LTVDRKYCLVTDEKGGSPRLLKIWNVQNLSNITIAATWQPTPITDAVVHNVEVYGNLAVIAHYTAGIRIVDISNPESPQEIAWYDTSPSVGGGYVGCWGVYMFPSGKIIGSDMQLGLFVIKMLVLITGNENTNSIPEHFELRQNYPNPFNPSTTIEYSLPKDSYVTLKIFDAAGKQVALLADEFKKAGEYNIRFNSLLPSGALPSGIYFYKLQAAEFSAARKMILVR